MLTQIREKAIGGIGIAILAVIAVSFVFVGTQIGNFSGVFAAKVNGSEIGVNYFENIVRNRLDENPQLASLPAEFRSQLRQGILDTVIRERLVDLYLAEAGYRMSPERIDEWIQSIPDFQVNGEYSDTQASEILAAANISIEDFRAQQMSELRRYQLQRAIVGTAVITPAEYRRYLNLAFEQRLVSVARFDMAALMADVEVTDELVEAFYIENDNLYQLPETATVQYIEFNRPAIAAELEISEQALQEHYEDSQNRYMQDEQRRARHILMLFGDDEAAAEAAAAAALARIQAGEAFEAVAADVSMDGASAPNGGDLGTMTRTQMPGELGAEIFALDAGQMSGLVKTEFGYHIVRVDEILEPGPLPLDQVRGELLNELRDRESELVFRDLQRTASDALFDTSDIAVIADTVGLPLQTVEGYQRSGGGTFGANQAVIDAVFDPAVLGGEISEIVEIDANRSAILRVSNYAEASRLPMDAVRDQIEAAIRSQQAGLDAFDKASALLAELEGGADFATTASAAGATVTAAQLISRQDVEADPAIVGAVFGAPKPAQAQPFRDQVPTSDGSYAVYSLEAVLPGRPETIPLDQRDQGKEQLTQQAGAADYLMFVQSLYDEADIVINEDVVAQQDFFQ